MTESLSEHCLCDKCGSDECKAGEQNDTNAEKVLEECETFDIIRFLKIRYGEEEAILDALENVEDEVLAELRQELK